MSSAVKLNYSIPPADGSQAFTQTYPDPVTGEWRRNWREDPHFVEIEDIRGKEDNYGLDTAGFQYFRHPAKHTKFTDDEEIKEEYYPESIELIKKLTGASRVVIFDHTLRRRRPGERGADPKNRQPATYVHVDQTMAASIARVHKYLPASDAPALLRCRFQIINLWRPISHPAVDWPLAVCDFRSLDTKTDLMPTKVKFPDREGEVYGVKFNPGHKWMYKSAMDPEDIILFKCSDSIQDGSVATFVAHTSFEDPKTPKDAPFRESIELRALVFYDEK
ncbi:hypothetical protein EV401DRAFT_1036272 [Pisolithus croceorrhizus]|nr:hypothetical protein EV401DRAFT_1036272 [Pisolithus croceorrhizus]